VKITFLIIILLLSNISFATSVSLPEVFESEMHKQKSEKAKSDNIRRFVNNMLKCLRNYDSKCLMDNLSSSLYYPYRLSDKEFASCNQGGKVLTRQTYVVLKSGVFISDPSHEKRQVLSSKDYVKCLYKSKYKCKLKHCSYLICNDDSESSLSQQLSNILLVGKVAAEYLDKENFYRVETAGDGYCDLVIVERNWFSPNRWKIINCQTVCDKGVEELK